MTAPAEVLTPTEHAAELYRHVVDVIAYAGTHDPRSLQAHMGPSEVGHPCDRRILYKLLDSDRPNVTDPWRSIVGRAVHAWLGSVFEYLDLQAGGGRYLVESPVDPAPGLDGTSDLFVLGPSSLDEERLAVTLDRLAGTVVDWKIVGPTSLTKYRRSGPSQVYKVQLHTYGKGRKRAGERVEWVSMVCLPAAGSLRDAYVWSAPFDESVADWAIKRRDDLALLAVELGPDALAVVPAKPDGLCGWCPYFRPGSNDLTRGCPGGTTQRGQTTG